MLPSHGIAKQDKKPSSSEDLKAVEKKHLFRG
jgi:hypothetical protein